MILQGDALNRTTIQTAVVIVLTSNVRAASAAGNVLAKIQAILRGIDVMLGR